LFNDKINEDFGPSQGENNTNMKSPADDPVNEEVMVFFV